MEPNGPYCTLGEAKRRRVVGYLPDYRIAELNPGCLRSLTDLIFFSIAPTREGGIDGSRLSPQTAALLREWKEYYRLRLWVTLGGWGFSSDFAPMVADPTARRKFVSCLTEYCLTNGFSGADFDWEHPADAREEAAYADLLVETQRAFSPHRLWLSATVAPWQSLNAHAVAAVDVVNLMSYDHSGRHSTLQQAKVDTERLLNNGVPAHKLCLGIPFYGRDIENPEIACTYANIVARFHPDANTDEVENVYFNGVETVREKMRYAQFLGLSGVMIWELGQDTADNASLLAAIASLR